MLANPDGITPEQLEEAIRSRFSDLQVWPDILHFQPEALGWPTAYFSDYDTDQEDLTVREIDEIKRSQKSVTSDYNLKALFEADTYA